MKHCGCLTNEGWPCVSCEIAHAEALRRDGWLSQRVLAGHDLDLYLDTRDDLARWDDPDAE